MFSLPTAVVLCWSPPTCAASSASSPASSGGAASATSLLLDGLAFETLIVLSTALFTRSALAQPGRWRRPWLIIAAGLIAVLLGSLTAALYQVIVGSVPSPSLADVFFFAFYPLILAGLLQFPGAVTTKTEALGFALDAVAVLFGSGMMIAYVLIIPTAGARRR